jgi:hypothetical protein
MFASIHLSTGHPNRARQTADPSTTRPPAANAAAEKTGGRFAQDDNIEGMN